MKNNHLWMNREHGHLLTYAEMIEEAAELYDVGDDTNAVALEEYYEDTGDEVPEDWDEWRDNEDGEAGWDDDSLEMGFNPYEGSYNWDC